MPHLRAPRPDRSLARPSAGRRILEPMRVLFLDVDGVLNRLSTIAALGCTGLEPDCLRLLRRILDATDARVVLSSTWREDADLRAIVAAELGSRLIGDTPVLATLRGQEILAWLADHDVARCDEDPAPHPSSLPLRPPVRGPTRVIRRARACW